MLRICSVFALSTEKRQSDSLGRARLYCDNSQVMALVRFYTAGTLLQTIVRGKRERVAPYRTWEGARKILVRGNKSQHHINGVSQSCGSLKVFQIQNMNSLSGSKLVSQRSRCCSIRTEAKARRGGKFFQPPPISTASCPPLFQAFYSKLFSQF